MGRLRPLYLSHHEVEGALHGDVAQGGAAWPLGQEHHPVALQAICYRQGRGVGMRQVGRSLEVHACEHTCALGPRVWCAPASGRHTFEVCGTRLQTAGLHPTAADLRARL